jgi:hypothetical protein
MKPPHAKTKVCGKCRRCLLLIPNVTFNYHCDTVDGFQPFCRECDHWQKKQQSKCHARLMKVLNFLRHPSVSIHPNLDHAFEFARLV